MKSNTHPVVGTVILNWNNYEDTSECVRSVLDQSYPNHQVYIVDNGSTDGSGKRLEKEFDQCQLIYNGENLGFAKGCNQGIMAASEESDYVLLINNDCTFRDADAIRHAVSVAESRPDAGIVGGKIYYDGTNRLWSACGEIDWIRGRGIHYGHDDIDQGEYNEIEEVEFVSGALMLISSDVIEDVGLLPEEYFFGAEEWDYSVQVRRSDFSLYRCPKFVVDHEVGASHKTFDQRFIYNTYRNKLLFQRRNLPRSAWLLWYLVFRIYVRTLLPRKLESRIESSDESANLEDVIFAVNRAITDDRGRTQQVRKAEIEQFGSLG